MYPLLLLLPLLGASSEDPVGDDPPGLFFDRGEALGFAVPADEQLEYEVILDVAVVGETGIGEFRLSSGVELQRAGLGSTNPGEESGARVGWIRGHAVGSALNYDLDHMIETRILPQAWPHVIYRDTQQGSESRKRELMYGERDGQPSSWYRYDGHCGGCKREEHMLEGSWPFTSEHHCKRCRRGEHRVWRKPTIQEAPAGSLDMLSAIFLARSLVREGRDSVEFFLLDKKAYWVVKLTRAERRVIETPAGSFKCVEVKLDPELPSEKKEGRFRGLFGIHGTLSIWLDEASGVPVEIGGMLPIGIMDLAMSIRLARYRGTPADFQPTES